MAGVTETQFNDAVQNMVMMAADKLGQAVDLENDKLDEQIRKLESMGADDLEVLRERRILQMKRQAEARQRLKLDGHGEYREVLDTKDFFTEVKKPKMCVCHFYRDATDRCRIIDKHLGILAPKYIETKFIKVNAEKHPYLAEKLHIYMLPTVVLIKEGKTDHSIIGFDEMGGADDFRTEMIEWVLAKWQVIDFEGDVSQGPPEADSGPRAKPMQRQTGKGLRQRDEESDGFDSDFD